MHVLAPWIACENDPGAETGSSGVADGAFHRNRKGYVCACCCQDLQMTVEDEGKDYGCEKNEPANSP